MLGLTKSSPQHFHLRIHTGSVRDGRGHASAVMLEDVACEFERSSEVVVESSAWLLWNFRSATVGQGRGVW